MRLLFGLLAAAAVAASSTAARAEHWCGFIDVANAQVNCGYSSIAECKQATGDKKGAVCLPDPGFAKFEGRQLAALSPER
ncbi:MAG TPA: DUF3551 domain-containing protein [Pseudolabrys sp.]